MKALGAAMRRVGACTVRSLGQGAVTLKVPIAVAGDAAQLGLAAPQFTDVPIAEAIVRKGVIEMPAEAVHTALKVSDASAVVTFLGESGGVVASGEWFAIVGVDVVSFFGEICFYRLHMA